MTYLKDQLYHANWIIFFLIVGFSFFLGKMNMKKEVKKIHKDIDIEIAFLRTMLKTIFDRVETIKKQIEKK